MQLKCLLQRRDPEKSETQNFIASVKAKGVPQLGFPGS